MLDPEITTGAACSGAGQYSTVARDSLPCTHWRLNRSDTAGLACAIASVHYRAGCYRGAVLTMAVTIIPMVIAASALKCC